MNDNLQRASFRIGRNDTARNMRNAFMHTKRILSHESVHSSPTMAKSKGCKDKFNSAMRWLKLKLSGLGQQSTNNISQEIVETRVVETKKTLLIELDQLVLSMVEEQKPREANGLPRSDSIEYNVRPDWSTFLFALSRHYRLGIWTVLTRKEAEGLTMNIDPDQLLTLKYYREDCIIKKIGDHTEIALKVPENINVNRNDFVLLDINPLSVAECLANTYIMPTYVGESTENCLSELIHPLISISKLKDVRNVTTNIDHYNTNVVELMDFMKKDIPCDETHDRKMVKVQEFNENCLQTMDKCKASKILKTQTGSKSKEDSQPFSFRSPQPQKKKSKVLYSKLQTVGDRKPVIGVVWKRSVEDNLESVKLKQSIQNNTSPDNNNKTTFTFGANNSIVVNNNSPAKLAEAEQPISSDQNIKLRQESVFAKHLRLSLLVSDFDVADSHGKRNRTTSKKNSKSSRSRIHFDQDPASLITRPESKNSGSKISHSLSKKTRHKTHVVKNQDDILTYLNEIKRRIEAERLRSTVLESLQKLR